MPVSIPTLNRMDTTNVLPKNDRISAQVNDQASNILNRTQGIASVGGQVGDIYQKYENDKIDQLSNDAEQEYTAWNNQELTKLKKLEGDPTDAYVEYDKKSKEKYNEILANRPDLNDRVKRHLTSRLDKTVGTQNVASLKQRGQQQEVYANNNFEATVKLKKDQLPVVAGYVQAGDQSTFQMFDDGLRDMKDLIVKRGLSTGTVTRLPDDAETYSHKMQDPDNPGKEIKVQMSDLAKQRFAKESSEGVKNSIEVLIAGGQVQAAKDMQEKYKGYIDPVSNSKIDKKFAAAGRKDEAYNFIQTIKDKSPEDQLTAIDKIKDPELRSEALKIKDTDDNRIESMKNRKAKANYDTLASQVIQKMNSDQPYYGIADLENDPLYKQTWDNLKPKDQKNIMEMVAAPKESNPKSLVKLNQLMVGDTQTDIEKMSVQDFQEYTSGLNKSDRAKANTWFNKQKNPSASEERASVKKTNELVRDHLLRSGYLVKDNYGKISGDDDIRYLEVQNKIMDYYAGRKTIPGEKEMSDIAKKFAASEIDKKVFNPYTSPVKTPGQKPVPQATNATTPSGVDPLANLSLLEVTNLRSDYARKFNNGVNPRKSDPAFIKYVQENGKK